MISAAAAATADVVSGSITCVAFVAMHQVFQLFTVACRLLAVACMTVTTDQRT